MLRVLIGKYGGELIDLSKRLDAETDIVLDCVRERDEFKRAYSDVELRLHNFDKYLTQLFFNEHPTTAWNVEVWEDVRRLFQGRLDEPITLQIASEWCVVHAFDFNKVFWERARNCRVYTWMFNDEFTGLELVLKQVLFRFNYFKDIVAGLVIDSMYINKTIRTNHKDIVTNGVHSLSSEFAMSDIDNETTVENFLLDVAQYYNAEFFINPENGCLTMKQRQTVLNDVNHDLDRLMRDNSEPEIDDSDLRTYDYVHLNLNIKKPDPLTVKIKKTRHVEKILQVINIARGDAANTLLIELANYQNIPSTEFKIEITGNTTFNGINDIWTAELVTRSGKNYIRLSGHTVPYLQSTNNDGTFTWLTIVEGGFTDEFLGYEHLYVIPFKTVNIESGFSEATGLVSNNDGMTQFAEVTVPQGPIGTTHRIVVRHYSETDRRIVKVIVGNEVTTFTDTLGNKGNQIGSGHIGPPTSFDPGLIKDVESLPQYFGSAGLWTGDVWLRYDEMKGIWDSYISVIQQDQSVIPTGKIFEFAPNMKSKEGRVLKFLEFLELFGSESITALYEQWRPFFLTHRKVRTELKGKGYGVGDSMLSTKNIFPNDFTSDKRLVIKNPKIHLMKEYTEVEAYTI